MSLALYRKYRPSAFGEVIGQEHVTEPLQQALRNGRIHHAYLFSGPRGCGKTSSARILARSLNCEQGPTPTPCGSCRSCRDLAPNGPGSLDIIEIDAASHGGVDDARDLRERAFYAPVQSRYKVYILDEAHMVSGPGWNALLKVVEEPPEFLKFVFATTEPEKVISTIRSRTHHYPFRLVPPSVLREHLAAICTREEVVVDPLALPLVVRAGAGSVRDALSILDQLVAGASAEGVTYARALALLGYTDAALLDEIVDGFAAGDGAAVFAVIDRVVEGGHDPRRFTADLLERLRDLVILAAVPEAGSKGLLDCPADRLERMTAQAQRMGYAALSRAADLANVGLTEMRGATAPRLLLELLCARILLPAAAGDESSRLARLERVERRLDIAPPSAAPATSPHPPSASASTARPEQAGPPPAGPPPAGPPPAGQPGPGVVPSTSTVARSEVDPVVPAAGALGPIDAAAVRRIWPEVREAVKRRRRTTSALLVDATVTEVAGGRLTLQFPHRFQAQRIKEGPNEAALRAGLQDVVGVDFEVVCLVGDGVRGTGGGERREPSARPAPGPVEGFAPGDEAVEDEPGDARDAPRLSGDAAAVALLRQGLGARVIGELDAT